MPKKKTETDEPTAKPAKAPKPKAQAAETETITHPYSLIKQNGSDFRYIGVSPSVDPVTAPDGTELTSMNTLSTPLSFVGFNRDIPIRKDGEFAYPPAEANSWADCGLE